eukprot:gene3790-13859_t
MLLVKANAGKPLVIAVSMSKQRVNNANSSFQDDLSNAEQAPLLDKDTASTTTATPGGAPTTQEKPLNMYKMLFYATFNILSSTCIVFANKAVFAWFGFTFIFALTLIHSLFTWAGMSAMARMGFFTPKDLPAMKLAPIAIAFVGYISLGNISLNLNSVGFYQIMKVAITPTVVALEVFMFSKYPSTKMLLSIVVVCLGVAIATVTDPVVVNNALGLIVGMVATLVTGMYQVWVGSKQKELATNSSQLLHAYIPLAVAMLTCLVPLLEPVGFQKATPDTLIGYNYTWAAIGAITLSAVLGVMVSFSTFLLIGATSSLTYNVVGHLKTVIILTGGYFLDPHTLTLAPHQLLPSGHHPDMRYSWYPPSKVPSRPRPLTPFNPGLQVIIRTAVIILTGGFLIFNEPLSWARFTGICVAMSGIGWYTYLSLQAAKQKAAPEATSNMIIMTSASGSQASSPAQDDGKMNRALSSDNLGKRPTLTSSQK